MDSESADLDEQFFRYSFKEIEDKKKKHKDETITSYNYDDEFDVDQDMEVLNKEFDRIMDSPTRRFRRFRFHRHNKAHKLHKGDPRAMQYTKLKPAAKKTEEPVEEV